MSDDPEARARALAKEPQVLAPYEEFEPRRGFRFTLGDYEEGGTGGWMALTVTGDKFSVWLPVEAQQSRFLVFFNGEALPISRQSGDRYVARFLIGGNYRVRVSADRRNGDVYVALPTAPGALEFIHWVRWQSWPEWVEASEAEGYEVRVMPETEWRSQDWSEEEMVRFHLMTVREDPATGTRYLRRKR
jgi:hypothetical protein